MDENVLVKSKVNLRGLKVVGIVLVVAIAMLWMVAVVSEKHSFSSVDLDIVDFIPLFFLSRGADVSIMHLLINEGYVALFAFIIHKALSSVEITVTDRRVYGRTWFGREVNIPFNQISAVGTNAFGGIAVGSSSGNISFLFIENKETVYAKINEVLNAYQIQKKDVPSPIDSEEPIKTGGNLDDLKKCKELLNAGIITQEEFDAKKRQILGL